LKAATKWWLRQKFSSRHTNRDVCAFVGIGLRICFLIPFRRLQSFNPEEVQLQCQYLERAIFKGLRENLFIQYGKECSMIRQGVCGGEQGISNIVLILLYCDVIRAEAGKFSMEFLV